MSSHTSARSRPSIQAAAAASNELVCALCAPAVEHGLDASSCRALLCLAEVDCLSATDLAARLGAPAVEELKVLERADLIRCTDTGCRLTGPGHEVVVQLRASACPERFASLQAEISTLRDLLCQTIVTFERRVARAA